MYRSFSRLGLPLFWNFSKVSLMQLHRSAAMLGRVVQFKLSDIGEGIAEVQVKEWFVKVGDKVSQFDNLCDVQSDKASVTITSRYDGTIKRIYHDVDAIAKVGLPLVDVELEEEDGGASSSDSESESSSPSTAQESTPSTSPQAKASPDCPLAKHDSESLSSSVKPLATPAVRRIAMENSVDLKTVKGTGRDGRVLKEDVLRHLGHIDAAPSADDQSQKQEVFMPRPIFQQGHDHQQPVRGYMRAMVKTMERATAIPHFCYCDEICVDRLVDLRGQLKDIAKEKDIKMSYMPLFIKAASLALHNFPIINSSLDDSCETITFKAAHNICVAMDTPDGLVVPNIKHCEVLSVWEIAKELNRLQAAAKQGRLSKEDLADGTFTLSNIGTVGGTYAAPVIFIPQVCIGAIGSIQVLPRYDTQMQIQPMHMVKISWAADHRVVDGATMGRFSNLWKTYLENPALMIAQMK